MIKAILTGHSQGLGEALGSELLTRGIAVLGLARGRAPAPAAHRARLLSEQNIDLSDVSAKAAPWQLSWPMPTWSC